MNTYNEIAKEIHLDNKAKGFWDNERNVGEMLMLQVTELGEAMEAHRKGRFAAPSEFRSRLNELNNSINTDLNPKGSDVYDQMRLENFKKTFEANIKDTFEDEVADAMIRIFDMAGGLGIDLDFHIAQKLKYNRTRARLHGKNY